MGKKYCSDRAKVISYAIFAIHTICIYCYEYVTILGHRKYRLKAYGQVLEPHCNVPSCVNYHTYNYGALLVNTLVSFVSLIDNMPVFEGLNC